jgi:hypothetical protein
MAAIILGTSLTRAQFDDSRFFRQFAAEDVECNARAPEDGSDDHF